MALAIAIACAVAAGCDEQGSTGTGASPDGGTIDGGTTVAARLSVSGSQILDPSGKPILLRGWNWGQWGSVQPQDGADNSMQGANVVRIPLRWWGMYADASIDSRSDAAPGHIDPAHLTLLDATIKEATDNHLWVDLFVDSNCGQASVMNDTAAYCGIGSDGQPANFVNDAMSKQKFIELWEFLVKRYSNTPFIGMYEILPEPSFTCSTNGCKDWTTAPTFYASVIPYLRAIDARTPILVGADGGYELKQIATAYMPNVPNLIYTGDILTNSTNTPTYITGAAGFRTQFNVPIFIQQVGLPKSDTNAAMNADMILSLLNGNGIGWTWWTYRETRSPNGLGFAPYWENNGPWSEDSAWLNLITGRFK
jgi:hypothetical protein